MKRQGTYGFTFDSEAEEWAAWCVSVWEHDEPDVGEKWFDHHTMTQQYLREYARDVAIRNRHSPAQQQNGCEIGEGSGRPRNRIL